MNLSEAHGIIWKAMLDHKLFDLGWSFEWDRAKRRFGKCSFQGKVISMSAVLVELNTEKEVRDTILHEIAHALVGPNHDHDFFWRMWARKVGARPIACYDSNSIVQPTPKFIGKCLGCGKEIFRYKLTRRVTGQALHTACRREGKEAKIEWRKA